MSVLGQRNTQTSSVFHSETTNVHGGEKRNMERLLWRNISSALPCHLSHFASRASRVHRRTHFALFRWAITQNSPLCWAQRRSGGSKNITSVMCDFFCHINGTSRYLHLSPKLYFNANVAETQMSACCVGDDSCCRFPRGVLDSPTPLQAFVWWTERQSSGKELSKMLTLIDTIVCDRTAVSSMYQSS